MRVLLDTHAFIWWIADDPKLPEAARQVISEGANTVFVSAATAWEITTKYRLGKLPGAALIAADVSRRIAAAGFAELAVTVYHAQTAGSLPGEHKDPFDRLLIAHALLEGIGLVSNERSFDSFGVARIW